MVGNVQRLRAKPSAIMNMGPIIDVEAMIYDDTRVLLGYKLYCKAAPYQNVSLFDENDANGYNVLRS